MDEQATPEPKRRHRSWLLGCALAATISALLVVIFVVGVALFARHRLLRAKAAAAELCAAYPVGAPVAGFEARARRLDLRMSGPVVRQGTGEPATEWRFASGGMFTDRWGCAVTARQGLVVESEVTFQD